MNLQFCVQILYRLVSTVVYCVAPHWDFFEVAKMNGCGAACATTKHMLSPVDILRYNGHFSELSSISKKHGFWITSL